LARVSGPYKNLPIFTHLVHGWMDPGHRVTPPLARVPPNFPHCRTPRPSPAIAPGNGPFAYACCHLSATCAPWPDRPRCPCKEADGGRTVRYFRMLTTLQDGGRPLEVFCGHCDAGANARPRHLHANCVNGCYAILTCCEPWMYIPSDDTQRPNFSLPEHLLISRYGSA